MYASLSPIKRLSAGWLHDKFFPLQKIKQHSILVIDFFTSKFYYNVIVPFLKFLENLLRKNGFLIEFVFGIAPECKHSASSSDHWLNWFSFKYKLQDKKSAFLKKLIDELPAKYCHLFCY